MSLQAPAILVRASLAAACGLAPGLETTYLRSRGVLLDVGMTEAGLAAPRVWIREADSGMWREAPVERIAPATLRFDAVSDGTYDFWLTLAGSDAEGGAGRLLPPPAATPQVRVTVDTTLPTVQIHAAEIVPHAPELEGRLRVTLIEENLGPAGIRLFVRPAGQLDWRDGGVVAPANGWITAEFGPTSIAAPEPHVPPAGALDAGAWDFMLVVTDLAGNRGWHAVESVAVGRAGAAQSPPDDPGAPRAEPGATEADQPAPASAPVFHPLAIRQREAARRFIAQGHWPLAAARLEEALRFAPEDLETSLELAQVERRMRRFNEAEARLKLILERAPAHVGGLEESALLALEQGRYSEARERLRRLTELAPDDAEQWRRLGDVCHRLGDLAGAREAWSRALELAPAGSTLHDGARLRLETFRAKP